MGLVENIKRRGLRDILSPKHWCFFVKAKATSNWDDKQAKVEQILVRQSLCPQCFIAGKCIGDVEYLGEDSEERCKGCACPSPELFHEEQMVCSCGKWAEMQKAKDWNKYKKEIGLEIITKYK